MGERIESPRWKQLCNRLRLIDIEDKCINFLSSGELRKLLIVNLLFDLPDVLILDNPYIGLDSASRKLLDNTIEELSSQGVNVVMLLCNPVDIPQNTTTVIPIDNLTIGEPIARQGEIEKLRQAMNYLFDYAVDLDSIPARRIPVDKDIEVVLNMNKCKVCYGKRTILSEVSWTVKTGERWALAGPNGSGKSTLLSLVYADNPQGYTNDITLFDRRRGTGETIWDIKSRIGYISPEMHLYFNTMSDVVSMVAQGLNNTIGDFRVVTPAQKQEAMRWLKILHIEHLAEHRFNTLSTGEQRLALLARTFIKQPQLLILDEPLHGLDMARKRSVRAIINRLVARDGLTLIYVTHYLSEVPDCVTHTKTLERKA
jgi:molybdate transport system ATP-binding protein